MKIADRILQLCDQKDISVNKLAALSDMTQSTLADIVKGKNVSPKVSTIEKICKGLDISLADFFTYESDLTTAHHNENELDNLPENIRKEIELAKEFVLYKHGIKKLDPKK
ncbi:transcriptional regulator with XRE-family HTH domain [Sporomusaceae bacterium BoRhaA]|uniref:helix-turn-helix domain-containing protein n=1 Tax=Pelorhabdus rhamnosifermentans TaxID=2772457 RepID=UPI001C064792|nr:helix-turn-helix transcriptional regulator [Pelorhabdus rhamnosifermentans]MBU2703781.1 transcriptional regulator with XRE-family HTH domain [Pelorhabdus rhamnosifermentans]